MAELERAAERSRNVFRYALLAAAALVVLAGAILAYVASTFDPRDYHDRIVALVKEKTGRTLHIQGEISLSMWPRLGVRLGQLSLSEPQSEQQFLTLESARVALELVPLLSREIVATELAITGLSARIIRDAEGRLNIDDLLRDNGATVPFDIARLTLERSALVYHDLSSGARYELVDIALEAGRLANTVETPLKLLTTVRDGAGTFIVHTRLQGRLGLDLEGKQYALRDAAVEMKGHVPGLTDLVGFLSGDTVARREREEFEISALKASISGKRGHEEIKIALETAKLVATPGNAHGEALKAALDADGPAGTTAIRLVLASVRRREDRVVADRGSLELDLQRGEHKVRAGLSASFDAGIAARAVALTALEANFTATGPRLPPKGVSGTMKGDARVDASKQGVQVNLAGAVGESQVKAHVQASGFAAPVYTFAVELDQLDLDRYLVHVADARQRTPASAGDANLLAPLAQMPATGTLTVGLLRAADVKASNVRFELK